MKSLDDPAETVSMVSFLPLTHPLNRNSLSGVLPQVFFVVGVYKLNSLLLLNCWVLNNIFLLHFEGL